MGDFDLTLPGRGHGFNLGVPPLRLDPALEREIRALQSHPPSPRLRQLFLYPNWRALQQSYLDALLRQPPPAPAAPLVPRGRGPATPRAGELSDLLEALWAIPVVQQSANRVLDDAAGRLRRDWSRLSTGEQALVISHGALLLGGAIAGASTDPESRDFLFSLIVNRDIPVPGIEGLTFRVTPRGAGATLRDIAGSGVTVSGAGGVDRQGRAEYNVNVMLDVTRFLP